MISGKEWEEPKKKNVAKKGVGGGQKKKNRAKGRTRLPSIAYEETTKKSKEHGQQRKGEGPSGTQQRRNSHNDPP